MSTPVGDEPTRGSAGDRRAPGREGRARPRADEPGASPVTVEQLLARQGGGVGRRAARRAEEDDARRGLPPVPAAPSPPGATTPPRRGLPPVPDTTAPPAGGTSRPVPGAPPAPPRAGLPPVPVAGRPATPGEGADRSGVRRSGPLPPLPGRALAPPDAAQDAAQQPPAAGSGDAGSRQAGRAARRAPASPGRRRIVRAVVALVAVVGLVALYHLGLYFYVDRSIDRVHALSTDGPEILAPQLQAGTENYLVVGTHVPGEKGAASVTALLASVSADGDRAVVVSVPPTALVDTPACRTASGTLREPRTEAFADALLEGGPSCLVRSVQELSGLRVDHYLDLDLARLPGLVDALGGVSLCVQPSPAVSTAAAPLPAGSTSVSGTRAGAYLRPADPTAEGAAAGVAARTQSLLTATLRTAMSPGVLLNTPKLTRFLTRASSALTVDDQTTLGDLRGLGTALGRLSGGGAQRADLPVAEAGYVPAGSTRSYVLLDGPGTRALFDGVIDRTRVPVAATPPQAEAAPAPGAGDAAPSPTAPAPAAPAGNGAAQPLTVAPSGVTVDVLNGTGTAGLAGTAADALRGQGFGVGTVGNATGSVTQTVVRYAPAAAEQARTVAAAVPGAVLQEDPSAGVVQLVLGPGYSRVVAVPAPAAAPATSASPVASASSSSGAKAATPAPVTC